ncbi:hypothetical protein [Streptomyces diacarni]|nr:hypothetical protein [Streptomyces diacarni]
MTDRRRRTAASDSTSREDNPFAPPPEGQPDQPWQPRQPRRLAQEKDDGSDPDGPRGPRGPGGPGPDAGRGSGGGGDGSGGDSGSSDGEQRPSAWGSQWSSRQPGRHGGSFGGGDRGNDRDRDRQGNGDRGPGGPGGGPGGSGGRGMRWDPTDPLQRHARYALHAGIWGLFFALLGVPEAALLLGALSLYWGISALRGNPPKSTTEGRRSKGDKRRRSVTATAEDVAGTDRSAEGEEEPGRSAGPGGTAGPGGQGGAGGPDGRSPIPLAVTPAQAAKAKRTAAISGLVTAGLTLAIVAATYTFQFAYSEYYTCQNDALTQSSRDDCERHLPEELQPFLENR